MKCAGRGAGCTSRGEVSFCCLVPNIRSATVIPRAVRVPVITALSGLVLIALFTLVAYAFRLTSSAGLMGAFAVSWGLILGVRSQWSLTHEGWPADPWWTAHPWWWRLQWLCVAPRRSPGDEMDGLTGLGFSAVCLLTGAGLVAYAVAR